MWLPLRVIVFSGLRYAVPVLLLLLTGCSSGGGSEQAADAPSASASPSRNPLIGGPAPDAALEPLPSDVRLGLDAPDVLKPGVEHGRLGYAVERDLKALTSVHIETTSTKDQVTASNDVDDSGRCSGEMVDHGHHMRFVTTKDARMLITTDEGSLGAKLDGRWVETPLPLADACPGGPIEVTFVSTGIGNGWAFYDPSRRGVERVDGRRAVHFRKVGHGWKIDTWVAAEGTATRLVKLIVRDPDGNVTTSLLSEFDSADPVAPEPPADQVVTPGTSKT